MRGSGRILVGLLIVFGSVGGLDNAADSELMLLTGLAGLGMLLMVSGIKAMKDI
jgi:hypothetical protein